MIMINNLIIARNTDKIKYMMRKYIITPTLLAIVCMVMCHCTFVDVINCIV